MVELGLVLSSSPHSPDSQAGPLFTIWAANPNSKWTKGIALCFPWSTAKYPLWTGFQRDIFLRSFCYVLHGSTLVFAKICSVAHCTCAMIWCFNIWVFVSDGWTIVEPGIESQKSALCSFDQSLWTLPRTCIVILMDYYNRYRVSCFSAKF